jgi:hypothetical protein
VRHRHGEHLCKLSSSEVDVKSYQRTVGALARTSPMLSLLLVATSQPCPRTSPHPRKGLLVPPCHHKLQTVFGSTCTLGAPEPTITQSLLFLLIHFLLLCLLMPTYFHKSNYSCFITSHDSLPDPLHLYYT